MAKKPTTVAFFDVLGFENRLRSDGLRDLVAAYKQLTEVVKRFQGGRLVVDGAMPLDGPLPRFHKDGSVECGSALYSLDVDHAYFSDTILLWADFDPIRIRPFCGMCAEFFCQVLHLGMPVRGAIAVGDAYMNISENTFVGYPVAEAARVEKAQEWIGISFGPSFVEPPYKGTFWCQLLHWYEGHRKPGYAQYLPGLVLDWPQQWRTMFPKEDVCRTLDVMDKNPKYSSYYRNAIRFALLSEHGTPAD